MRLLTALLCSLLAATASAGPFSDLIVFGDSLSDVGNVLGNPLVALGAGIDDFDDRFSNGPVYTERLSEGLGLGPLTTSESGGDNFANGGAETNGPGFFSGGSLIDSLVEQVDTYLDRIGTTAPDPDTLFVVFIGANDLFGGQTNVTTPAGVVRTQFDRLVDAGARRFLGVNLPLLGLTPDRFGETALSNLTRSYNSALAGVWDGVELANPDVTIHRLDVETLFSDLIDNAADFGFTNTTQPGQEVPGNSFDRAPGFVFWDGVHPTREAHALLGEAAIRAVLPAGDYDRDGFVTEADFSVWLNEFGATFDATAGVTTGIASDGNGDGRVDVADYALWRNAFAAAASIEAFAVPEPSALALISGAVASLTGRRRTRRFAA